MLKLAIIHSQSLKLVDVHYPLEKAIVIRQPLRQIVIINLLWWTAVQIAIYQFFVKILLLLPKRFALYQEQLDFRMVI